MNKYPPNFYSALELSEVVIFLLGFLTTTTKPSLLVFFITCASNSELLIAGGVRNESHQSGDISRKLPFFTRVIIETVADDIGANQRRSLVT